MEEKKKIYEKLTCGTEQMKEKIMQFDQINKDYHMISALLREKEEFLSSDKRIAKIKNTIKTIKVYKLSISNMIIHYNLIE